MFMHLLLWWKRKNSEGTTRWKGHSLSYGIEWGLCCCKKHHLDDFSLALYHSCLLSSRSRWETKRDICFFLSYRKSFVLFDAWWEWTISISWTWKQVQTPKYKTKKGNSSLICSHCKKMGHSVDKCPRIIGFPNDFKFTKIKRDPNIFRSNVVLPSDLPYFPNSLPNFVGNVA